MAKPMMYSIQIYYLINKLNKNVMNKILPKTTGMPTRSIQLTKSKISNSSKKNNKNDNMNKDETQQMRISDKLTFTDIG